MINRSKLDSSCFTPNRVLLLTSPRMLKSPSLQSPTLAISIITDSHGSSALFSPLLRLIWSTSTISLSHPETPPSFYQPLSSSRSYHLNYCNNSQLQLAAPDSNLSDFHCSIKLPQIQLGFCHPGAQNLPGFLTIQVPTPRHSPPKMTLTYLSTFTTTDMFNLFLVTLTKIPPYFPLFTPRQLQGPLCYSSNTHGTLLPQSLCT